MRRVLDNLMGGTEIRIILSSSDSKMMGDNVVEQNYTKSQAYPNPVNLEYSATDLLYHTYDSEGNVIDGHKTRTLIGIIPEGVPEGDAYRIYYDASPEITPLAKVVYFSGQTSSVAEATLYLQQGANVTEAHYPQQVPSGAIFLGWYRWSGVYPTVNVNDTFWVDGENEITVGLRPVWQFDENNNDNSNQNTPTLTNPDDDSDTPIVDPNAGNNDSDIDP